MNKKVSVVMTVYNGRKNLEITLPTLLKQTFPKREVEYIFVDAGSTDGTIKLIKNYSKDYPIKLIIEKGCTRSEGRNIGIRAAKANFVIIIDDDVSVDETFISRLYSLISRDEQIGAIAAYQMYPKNANFVTRSIWYIPGMAQVSEISPEYNPRKRLIPLKHVPAIAGIWRKKALLEAGLYNPKINWGEDSELTLRLDSRWLLFGAPQVKIVHHYKSSLKKHIVQSFWYGYGGAGLIRTLGLSAFRIISPLRFALAVSLPFVLMGIWLYPLLMFFLSASGVLALSFVPAVKAAVKEKSVKFFFSVLFLKTIKHIAGVAGFYYNLIGGKEN